MAPKVSVVIPVYNGARYLSVAVESILHQTFTDFELIIIDDGSTDETWTILNNFNDPRLRLVQNEKNIGVSKSANKGLALAQGMYIARMDADDISLPERLSRQVDFLETHPEIGVLGTGFKVIDGYGRFSDTHLPPAQDAILRWYLCFFCPIAHSTVMMRRQTVEQVGGYSSEIVLAEDYDLWQRLSSTTRLSNLQDVLVFYRIHDENASTKHALALNQTAARISRQMMSGLLNEEVPAGIVWCLWEQDYQTTSDVHLAAELVCRLYQAIVSNGELSITEKRVIRQDAARRLYKLALPRLQNVNIWGVLVRACYMDPLYVLRAVPARLRHILNIRSRLSR